MGKFTSVLSSYALQYCFEKKNRCGQFCVDKKCVNNNKPEPVLEVQGITEKQTMVDQYVKEAVDDIELTLTFDKTFYEEEFPGITDQDYYARKRKNFIVLLSDV